MAYDMDDLDVLCNLRNRLVEEGKTAEADSLLRLINFRKLDAPQAMQAVQQTMLEQYASLLKMVAGGDAQKMGQAHYYIMAMRACLVDLRKTSEYLPREWSSKIARKIDKVLNSDLPGSRG